MWDDEGCGEDAVRGTQGPQIAVKPFPHTKWYDKETTNLFDFLRNLNNDFNKNSVLTYLVSFIVWWN